MKAVEAAIADCKKALAESDVDRINAATESLVEASHKIAEVLYQSAAAAGTAGGARPGAGAPPPPQGEVIEGEYVDVDEKKKPN